LGLGRFRSGWKEEADRHCTVPSAFVTFTTPGLPGLRPERVGASGGGAFRFRLLRGPFMGYDRPTANSTRAQHKAPVGLEPVPGAFALSAAGSTRVHFSL